MNNLLNIKYAFPSYLNPHVEAVDAEVIQWAQSKKILKGPFEITQYRKMKITWFAARLYPEASKRKLTAVAKLFCLLFILDDYTDMIVDKNEFWIILSRDMMKAIKGEEGKLELFFSKAFQEVWEEISSWTGHLWQKEAQTLFEKFLQAGSWEARNRQKNRIPAIGEYMRQRVEFSGAKIAFILIPPVWDIPFELTQKSKFEAIQVVAGKIIYIANDLMSYEKEKLENDCHNLVLLIRHHYQLQPEAALKKVFDLHYEEVARFHRMEVEIRNCAEETDGFSHEFLMALRFLISGSTEWSKADTQRYRSAQNGN
ncbi:terpene synthase family protein [Litoribacter populi]|uniref:terpene synthase family protein n=1 Tax=Litoribacter populi TaxID=2598460 RepID=UPI00117D29ED|nr:terpene synthase family protein [Litoribacter populi]